LTAESKNKILSQTMPHRGGVACRDLGSIGDSVPLLTDMVTRMLPVRENDEAFSFSDGAGEGARGDCDRHGSRSGLRIFGSGDGNNLWRSQEQLCGPRCRGNAQNGQLSNPRNGDGWPSPSDSVTRLSPVREQSKACLGCAGAGFGWQGGHEWQDSWDGLPAFIGRIAA